MTRQRNDKRQWVMVCEQDSCSTQSEAFPEQPDLEMFQGRGWFIAKLWGDICPACLARGIKPTADPYRSAAQRVAAGGES